MRRLHFETLRPLCPVCRVSEGSVESELELATVIAEDGDDVLEGVLRCPRASCLREYPIIDGIPLIIAAIRDYVSSNLSWIMARDDLSETVESILGDCCGPGSTYDTHRQQLSSYVWDHYGDLDTTEEPAASSPGSVVRLLKKALELAGDPPSGPLIDIGCSVGRTTFELADRYDVPVLGIDLHFSMLRLASRMLRQGSAAYSRRRVGLVYDRRQLAARFAGAERVDFWACDATALPFAAATFAAAASLNAIDCVVSPVAALASMVDVLSVGGRAMIASPYDWSPAATPVEAWVGGHSQRASHDGASETQLRALLTPGALPESVPGLRVLAEEEGVPWRVRLHARSSVEYQVHLLAAEKAA